MAVASKRLGVQFAAGAGQHNIYTVPLAKRTILKSLWVRNNTAASFRFVWQITPAGGGVVSMDAILPATGLNGASVKFEPWVVMNIGDSLLVSGAAAGGIDVIASGAELDL